jgi:uncharacterized protein
VIIDFHTHVFSPQVIADRQAYLDRDRWFGLLYANPRARLASPASLLESMDRAGVGVSVICGFPWIDAGICASENNFLIQAAAESEGRFIAFATIPPAAGAMAAQEAGRALVAGARGIGELNACAQSFYYGDVSTLRPLMAVAQEHQAPLLLHAAEPVGRQYPGKGKSSPQGLWRLAKTFPQAKLVLAHWGGGLPFYALMPEAQADLDNVWYDTAASAYLYRPQVFDIGVRLVGADRILFGSDYPVIGQRRMLEEARAAGLEAAHLEAILGGNAARLLGLPE